MMRGGMNESRRKAMPAAILALGIALAVLGIWHGELADIWRKAAMVCLECIGIG